MAMPAANSVRGADHSGAAGPVRGPASSAPRRWGGSRRPLAGRDARTGASPPPRDPAVAVDGHLANPASQGAAFWPGKVFTGMGWSSGFSPHAAGMASMAPGSKRTGAPPGPASGTMTMSGPGRAAPATRRTRHPTSAPDAAVTATGLQEARRNLSASFRRNLTTRWRAAGRLLDRRPGAVAGQQALGDDLRLPLVPVPRLHALDGGGNLRLDPPVGSGSRNLGELAGVEVEAGQLRAAREVLRRLRQPPALRLQQQAGLPRTSPAGAARCSCLPRGRRVARGSVPEVARSSAIRLSGHLKLTHYPPARPPGRRWPR